MGMKSCATRRFFRLVGDKMQYARVGILALVHRRRGWGDAADGHGFDTGFRDQLQAGVANSARVIANRLP